MEYRQRLRLQCFAIIAATPISIALTSLRRFADSSVNNYRQINSSIKIWMKSFVQALCSSLLERQVALSRWHLHSTNPLQHSNQDTYKATPQTPLWQGFRLLLLFRNLSGKRYFESRIISILTKGV